MRKYLIVLLIILLSYINVYSNEQDRPWMQLVSEGAVPGYSFIEKFGENPDIDTATTPEDIWSHGGVYTYSTTADINRIVSEHASDTQDIIVVGLDENWDQVTQTVTLTGQTPVVLPTPLIRCFRMWNANGTDLLGDVHVYTGVGATVTNGVVTPDSVIRAEIHIDTSGNSSGQTEMAIYTIPRGHTGYLYNGYVGISRGGNTSTATFTPQIRNFGGVFRTIYRGSNIGQGSSHLQQQYSPPIVLTEKTDIKVQCKSTSVNDTGVFAGFTIVLKRNY